MRQLLVIILILIGLFQSTKVYAFSDDFTGSELSTDNWEINSNGGSYFVSDGFLTINQNQSTTYPYIVSKQIEEISNFVYEIRVQITGSYNYGFGVGLSEDKIPNGTTSNLQWSDFVFLVWPKGGSVYGMHTWLCPLSLSSCISGNYNGSLDTASFSTWTKYKIVKTSDSYQVYKNDNLISELEDINVTPRYIWFGNPQKTGVVSRGKIIVDYVYFNESVTEPSTSLILIPGFGASWNYGALFTNTPSDNWQIPRWLDTYQNLTDSFQNAGFTEGENLFIFPYDWRKPLNSLSTDFHNFIENLKSQNKIPPQNEIKIIGHSFGGLVARSYYQQYSPPDIKQIVTVGSPHKGILPAYDGWAGGKITHGDWWTKGIFSLILKINNQPGETDRQTLQRLAPSMSNILPTFSFLQDKNSNLKPISSHTLQNTVLNSLDSTIGTASSIFTALTGNQNNTPEVYTYVSPNWYDRLFGNWIDGKPINTTLTTSGDGTVLNLSAQGIFTNTYTSNLNHGDIVFDGQGIYKIFESLGLDTSKIIATRSGNFIQNVLAISLRSPGKIQVIDENNNIYGENGNSSSDYLYLPDEKILMIKEPTGDYKVNIISDGQTGEYKLFTSISNADQTITESKNGFLALNDIDSYQINTDSSLPLSPYASPDYVELLEENSTLLNQTCSTHQTALKNRCINLSTYLKNKLDSNADNNLTNLFYNLHQTFSQSQYDFPQDSDTYIKIKDITRTLENFLQDPTVTSPPPSEDHDYLYTQNTQTILDLELLFDTSPPTTPSANILKNAIDNSSSSSSQSANLVSDFFKLLIQKNYLETLY